VSPKTLGGVVIAKYGIRTWWHVQRVLIAFGTGARTLGREPSHREVGAIAYAGAVATLSRDMHSFKKVFPGRTPYEVWCELEAGPRVAPADAVLNARWSW
jgi:hypothetical protein